MPSQICCYDPVLTRVVRHPVPFKIVTTPRFPEAAAMLSDMRDDVLQNVQY